MYNMKRYAIDYLATPEQVGEFVAAFIDGNRPPLSLELVAYKCNERYGSPGSSNPTDFQGLTGSTHQVDTSFTPSKDSVLRYYSNNDEGNAELMIMSGLIALKGKLDLPNDDPFAIKVEQGFKTRLSSWFILERTPRRRNFRGILKVLEVPIEEAKVSR